MAEQVRCGVTARSRPGARRRRPDRGPQALPIAGTRPEGRAGPPREEIFNRVSARRAGSVTRHPQARPRPAVMWPPAAADVSLAGPLSCCRPAWPQSGLCRWLASAQLLPAGYALRAGGEFAAAGGAERPVLVPVLRWSSPAQVALPAVLRPARRFVPSAGRDPVAGRVVLLAAEPAGWTRQQQGPGQRASPAGGPGPGSRRPQRQPDGAHGASEPSPASEPLMLVEPQRVQARGYRRQFLPFSSACLVNGRVVTCSCRSRSAVLI